jgi:hypothetical protein
LSPQQQAGLWAADFPHAPWEHRSSSGKGPFGDYGTTTVEQCRKPIGKR